MKGIMPEINQMKKEELKTEVEMWRNVWQWVPSEVRYYVARTGSLVGITGRNYKRTLGTLLDTHWDITGLELGVNEKEYNPIDGKYYYERKVIKTKLSHVIDVQWIAERISEDEALKQAEQLEAESTDETPSEDKQELV